LVCVRSRRPPGGPRGPRKAHGAPWAPSRGPPSLAPGARTTKPKNPYLLVAQWHPERRGPSSARLSDLRDTKFRIVVETPPNRPRIRSESMCAGLWVPCRISWVWFGPALGQNPARNRRFSARSLKVFGAMFAQPSSGAARQPPIWSDEVPTSASRGRAAQRTGLGPLRVRAPLGRLKGPWNK
jgi:hypothetical protein